MLAMWLELVLNIFVPCLFSFIGGVNVNAAINSPARLVTTCIMAYGVSDRLMRLAIATQSRLWPGLLVQNVLDPQLLA